MGSNYMETLANHPKPINSNYSAINLPEKKIDLGAAGLSVWDMDIFPCVLLSVWGGRKAMCLSIKLINLYY